MGCVAVTRAVRVLALGKAVHVSTQRLRTRIRRDGPV